MSREIRLTLLQASVVLLLILGACQGFIEPLPSPQPTHTASTTPTPRPSPTPTPRLEEMLSAVCRGEGVPAAAAYSPDHAPHPAVVIGSPFLLLPPEWLAESLNQVELVICMEEIKESAGSCNYGGGSRIDRYKWVLKIRLLEARSGREISNFKIEGDPPPACPIMIVITGGAEVKQMHGSHPKPETLLLHIEPFITARQFLEDDRREFSFATSIAISPDGNLLAAGDQRLILIWDLSTGGVIQRFPTDGNFTWAAAFSNDSRLLATGDVEGNIHLWEVESGHQVLSLNRLGGTVKLAFSPDNRLLAIVDMDAFILLDWQNNTILRRVEDWYVTDIAFSPDGRYLAFTDYSGVWLQDLTGAGWSPVLLGTEDWDQEPLFVAFSADGQTLFSAVCWDFEYSGAKTCTLGETSAWETTTGTLLGTFPLPPATLDSYTVSTDGRWLASAKCAVKERTACITSQFDIWDVVSGSLLASFHTHSLYGQADTLALSPDSSLLAAEGSGSEIILWDLTSLSSP